MQADQKTAYNGFLAFNFKKKPRHFLRYPLETPKFKYRRQFLSCIFEKNQAIKSHPISKAVTTRIPDKKRRRYIAFSSNRWPTNRVHLTGLFKTPHFRISNRRAFLIKSQAKPLPCIFKFRFFTAPINRVQATATNNNSGHLKERDFSFLWAKPAPK